MASPTDGDVIFSGSAIPPDPSRLWSPTSGAMATPALRGPGREKDWGRFPASVSAANNSGDPSQLGQYMVNRLFGGSVYGSPALGCMLPRVFWFFEGG